MIVVYEKENGLVRWISRGPAGAGQLPDDLAAIEVEDRGEIASDVYVFAGELIQRPRMALEWHYEPQVGEVVVDRIPPGATVQTPNWEGTVNDGFIAWPVTEPGSYPIVVVCFPYYPEYINAEIT